MLMAKSEVMETSACTARHPTSTIDRLATAHALRSKSPPEAVAPYLPRTASAARHTRQTLVLLHAKWRYPERNLPRYASLQETHPQNSQLPWDEQAIRNKPPRRSPDHLRDKPFPTTRQPLTPTVQQTIRPTGYSCRSRFSLAGLVVVSKVSHPCIDLIPPFWEGLQCARIRLKRIGCAARRPNDGGRTFGDKLHAVSFPEAKPLPDFQRHGDLPLATDPAGLHCLYLVSLL